MTTLQDTTVPSIGSPPPMVPFTNRLLVGFIGILISAMMAGIANRVGNLALADTLGVLGLGADEGSWLNSVYLAGELVAMPFAIWLSTIISLRRFHCLMVSLFVLLSILVPFIGDWSTLLVLKGLQGLVGGMLIPILMLSALRFFPLHIRLYSMSLYALTATFSPNLGFWLAGQWTDVWFDWRMLSWQILPLALISISMVYWGIPQDPLRPDRLRETNWFGMFFGFIGICMIAIGLDQAGRLDWWRSDLICWLIGGGVGMTGVYLISEWYHPAPFIKPQLLVQKRNLGLGFSLFVALLVVMLSGSKLPAMHLGNLWGYRSLQNAPIGLIIALPQPVLGLAVSALLYQKWVDARHVLALGISFIAAACLLCVQITSNWIVDQFVLAQILQAIGQAMAVVALLFLSTSVVQPMEGPFVAGTVNILRAFGGLFGGALIDSFFHHRQHFHSEMLVDKIGQTAGNIPSQADGLASLNAAVREQAFVLANSDSYLMLGVFAILLIPFVLRLDYVMAPSRKNAAPINSSQNG